MKYLIVVVALFFLNGCTVRQAPIVEYRINPLIQEQQLDVNSYKSKNIKVMQAFSSNALMAQKMKYMKDELREYEFTESEWSQSPNKAITEEIVKSLTASELFASVQSYKSRSKSDLTLETTIEDFTQYFHAEDSYVKVAISMTLIETKSGRVVDSVRLFKQVDAKGANAQSGVIALNEALSDVLYEVNLWLVKVCQ